MATNVGEIDLSIALDKNQYTKGLNSLEKEAEKITNSVKKQFDRIGNGLKDAFSIQVEDKEAQKTITDLEKRIDTLQKKYDSASSQFGTAGALADQRANEVVDNMNTKDIRGMSDSDAESYIDDLIASDEQYKALSNDMVRCEQAMQRYSAQISVAREELNQLVATQENVNYETNNMQNGVNSVSNEIRNGINNGFNSASNEASKLNSSLNKSANNASKLSKESKSVTSAVSNMKSGFQGIEQSTKKGLKSLLSMGGALLGIRTAWSAIKNLSQEYLNSNNAAAQQINANLSYMKSALSNALAPAIQFVTDLAYNLLKVIQTIVYTLFRVNIFANATSDAYASTASSAASTAKSTKKTQQSLANFDNLDVLNQDTDDSGSGGGGSGTTTPTWDLSNVNDYSDFIDGIYNKIKKISNIFKAGFYDAFGDIDFSGILNHLNNIKNTLVDIWTDSEVTNAAKNWAKTVVYSLGQTVGSIARIGTNIAEGLVGSIDLYLSENEGRIKQFIITMFDVSADDFALIGEFSKALGKISDVFKSDTAKQIGANIIGMFANPLMSVIETLNKFVNDVLGVFLQPIIDNADKIKETIENILEPIEKITETLKTALTYIGDKIEEVYDNYIHPFLESVKEGFSDSFGKLLDVINEYFVPFFNTIADGISTLWENNLKPFIDKIAEFVSSVVELLQELWENWIKPIIDWIIENVVPKIVPILETIWDTVKKTIENIVSIVSGIIETFQGVIDFIKGIFSGDWEEAWDGIKEFFTGIWDTIISFIKYVWDLIFGTIKTVLTTIWETISTIFTAIKDTVVNVFNAVKDKISTIFNNIKNTISNIINNIKSTISNVFNNIKNTIVNVFTTVKDKISTIWNNIWDIIKTVVNKILEGIESFVNGFIKGINKILSGISNVASAVGSLIGLDPVNLQLSEISLPRLAQGGYVKANTPQLAMIGDNKTQGEIVAPEGKMAEMIEETLKKFTEQQNNSQQNKNNEITINFGGSLAQLARILKPELDNESKRRGDKLIIGGRT